MHERAKTNEPKHVNEMHNLTWPLKFEEIAPAFSEE
jgi:hypothetical protein